MDAIITVGAIPEEAIQLKEVAITTLKTQDSNCTSGNPTFQNWGMYPWFC